MRKTILLFSICSLITLANGQIGINVNTKTKDMTNYGGKVEISSKYENEVVKFDGKSKIVKYEDNTLKSIIAEDFYAKINLDLLKSEKNEVKLGAYITKNGEDAYKIEDKNDKAEAYLSYINRLTKNVELSTMTKLGTEILDDFTFDKGYFIQGLKSKVKFGNYTNTLGITYKYDKHHNLELVNRNELDINKVNIAVSPKISMENLEVKNERLYKPRIDGELNVDTQKAKFISKVYAETELKSINIFHYGLKTGLELGTDLVFNRLKFSSKVSTEFTLLKEERKAKKKDPLRIDEKNPFNLYDLVNNMHQRIDGFQNNSKLILETEYKGDNFEIKIKPEFETNLKWYNIGYRFDEVDENDGRYRLHAQQYLVGLHEVEGKNMFDGQLNIETKLKLTSSVNLKLLNKIKYGYKQDRRSNFILNFNQYIPSLREIHLLSNETNIALDLHKNVEGFKLSLIPSFNFSINQNWEGCKDKDQCQSEKEFTLSAMKYIAGPKKDNINEYEIQGTPFISLTPKIEFKLEKEFKNSVVLDLGVNGSKTYNFIREANGKVGLPDGQDKGLDFSSMKSSYEIGGNLGLTYKF